MKKVILLVAILFNLTSFSLADEVDSKVVDHLQNISCTIGTSSGSGSGVMKVRQRDKESITFVWTAAHVVQSARKTRDVIDSKTGTKRTIVEFDDVKIIQTIISEGRTVGKTEIFAEVVRYSSDEDLALLKVRKKNFTTEGVKFYLDENHVKLASFVVHVGSLLGESGSNSVTTGVMSQVGRLIDGKVFDQTTAASFPGSSGGGVFLKDGRMIGQVLRGAGETFVLICPVRRTVKWAKEAGVGWAVDDNVPLPSDAELKKIPIEDNGVSFNERSLDAAKHKFMFNKSISPIEIIRLFQ